jgi:putative ABC transport system permease protein
MLRATLRSLLARKLRLLLSAMAVVLGVSFVVGAFVLTDSLGRTFTDLFATVNEKVAVDVRGVEKADGSATGDGAGRQTVPATLVEKVRAVDGVAEVQGNVVRADFNQMSVLGKDGKALSTNGAPIIGANWIESTTLNQQRVIEGRPPQGPGEVLLDPTLAEKAGKRVGDTVVVFTPTGQQDVRVVGLVQYANGKDSLGGEAYVLFTTPVAQQVLSVPGYSDLVVAADSGVSQQELRDRVAAVLPGGTEAITGQQLADEQASDIQEAIGFLSTFLLVFAAVALFVGAFIIFNTFSILVAQRTRELALMRALGASRRQVTRSVLLEALAVGSIASALGIGAGIGVALGLQALFGAFGAGLPKAPIVIEPRTVVVAFAVGILVTATAALLPARRAAKVPPIAAMRDAATPDRSLVRQTVGGVALAVAGTVAITLGLTGSPLWVLGLGAVLAFLGVALLSPLVSRPVTGALGSLFSRRLPGRLGRLNSQRNPRRTAATAAALMIGLALVAAVGVLGASLKDSVRKTAETALGADFLLNPAAVGISQQAVDAVRPLPGLAEVTAFRSARVVLAGDGSYPAAMPASAIGRTVALDDVSGSTELRPGVVLVADDLAKDKGWSVGTTVPAQYPDGTTEQLRVGGTYKANELVGSYVLDESAGRHFDQELYVAALIKLAPDADAAQVRAALDQAIAPYPNVQLQDRSEFVGEITSQIDQLIQFFTLLLALSVLIAVLGIVNTLALSVLERTRELGLLRAVGMSRRQVKRMVRVESVLVAVFGGLLGLAVGAVFGVALQRALVGEGVTELTFPVGQLVVYLLAAAVAGVLAAWLPARRASRLNVLQAIAAE